MHYSEEYYSEDMLLDLSKVTPCLHMGRYVENDGEKHIFMVGVDTREVFEEY
jgi:hypothetical protein